MAEVGGKIEDPQPTTLEVVGRYASAAAMRAAAADGGVEREEVIQQVYLEWLEEYGKQWPLESIFDRTSEGHKALIKLVKRVIERLKYSKSKQRRSCLSDIADPRLGHDLIAWIDLTIDLSQGMCDLDAQSRRLLEYRRQGMTFEEMAEKESISKQEAHRLFQAAQLKLREILRDER